jgi:hypothetical protein
MTSREENGLPEASAKEKEIIRLLYVRAFCFEIWGAGDFWAQVQIFLQL